MNNTAIINMNQSSLSWKSIIVLCALLAPFFLFSETAKSIVSIWDSSETFAHGYIIAPISAWLIWRRREIFRVTEMKPFLPTLLILMMLGFVWMLADFAEVQVIKQYSFVAFFPFILLAILGIRLTWEMAFPLAFLMLAVPFGEAFVPPLIDFTADFTVAALQFTGIPVLREGTFFSIPSGNWSVVEACSGVRYLISSITLGCLYAYLTYRSSYKRALFILMSIIVPILANGLRAYLIVIIGHLSSMQLAVGFDHLIYGWLFFGFVMFLMFWVGSFWRDNVNSYDISATSKTQAIGISASNLSIFFAALCVVASLAMWPKYSDYVTAKDHKRATVSLANLQLTWLPSTELIDWKPAFLVPHAQLDKAFQRDWYRVGLSIRYYRNQSSSSKLVSSANVLVPEKNDKWRVLGSTTRGEGSDAGFIRLLETQIQDKSGQNFLVWQTYWVDNTFSINPYLVKALQARSMLLSNGDDGAAILVYAAFNEKPEEARISMRPFLKANMQQINSQLADLKLIK
jgi:exosortase A